MRRLLIGVVLLLPQTSRACLQDRDTLAEEARGLPDVVQTVTGRFPRNPPRFYEMPSRRDLLLRNQKIGVVLAGAASVGLLFSWWAWKRRRVRIAA